MLVVHGISLPPNQFGGPWIDDLFLGRLEPHAHPYFAEIAGLEVSAHCLIRRDGSLTQYVSFLERAWHAGRSCFMGREACNDFSIGVELEGTDTTPYTEAQYQSLADLARCLMGAYPQITCERIVGHCDIAPGRKTDPGPAFNWSHLRAILLEPA
ncbi:1,6-anhydro-N-acetylmuramyl-L-alanine amidase AmpD [Pseudaeromonas paramecii]|uniref:1,6-anhydro-N-acetylmuramyl-L-alanine amidase AmpD n=1 Tax=Pseudaeromonas paramecii TaxID=2138166 RepID=A0ABP8QAW8_9GAMM